MRKLDRWLGLTIALVMMLVLAGCAKESETGESHGETTSQAALETVEPPGDQDIDIEPGSISMGNVLNPTWSTPDQLPPQGFGTIASFEYEPLTGAGVPVESVKFEVDANNYLTIKGNVNGPVSWRRTQPKADGSGNETITVTALDTTAPGAGCAVMSANLDRFFQSGVTVKYTYMKKGSPANGNGTLTKSGEKSTKVKFSLALAANTPCAPS